MPYKQFLDFNHIKLKFGDVKQALNYGYTAMPNFNCADNELFEPEFFLIYRRSEYAAQVELACARIFHYLMGYGLEMDVVKEGEQFFVSSQRIKNFVEGCASLQNQKPVNVSGLVSIFVIWYFIGQTDTHSGNYGLANIGKNRVAFGLDMAEALDFEMLNEPLKVTALKQIPYFVEKDYIGVSDEELPKSLVASEEFQAEKKAMIKKIAETPFEVFATIIRNTITSNFSEHQRVMFEKLLTYIQDDAEREQTTEDFKKICNAQDYSLDALILLLKSRHEQWKALVSDNLDEVFIQDYTFSDASAFLQEQNKYHDAFSSGSEEFSFGPNYDQNNVELENSHSHFLSSETLVEEKEPGLSSKDSADTQVPNTTSVVHSPRFFTHKTNNSSSELSYRGLSPTGTE